MLFGVLCTLIAVHVRCEAPPAPPQSAHVDRQWLLTWPPAAEEREVTYTVQSSRFDSGVWTEVPACVRISVNSCNAISTEAEAEFGCVMLRVQAERRGQTSTPVQACSGHDDSCTPHVSLTAAPGFLTVNLSRNHSLVQEYGDHVKHRVYYGKEGEPWQKYEDAVASVIIPDLQAGQSYCAAVQYLYFDSPVGLASCTQCAVIPESKKDSKHLEVTVAVVLVVVLLVLMPMLAYFLIFRRGLIKQWLRPPYHFPENLLLEPFPKNHLPISSCSHTEEPCLVISSISPEERRQ